MSKEGTPIDRGHFVYVVMLLLGIGSVLPWNMFLNAQQYYVEYKLSSNSTEVTNYRNNFLSYLGVFAIGPNLILQLINLVRQTGCGSLKMRIMITSVIQMAIFVVTIGLAIVDSENWQPAFFFVTMATVILLNSAAGIFQNSTYAVAAKLPMNYTNGIVIGMNISGTYASVVSIISTAISSGLKPAAIYYFSSALIYLIVMTLVYWTLYKNPYYIHFNSNDDEEDHEELHGDSQSKETLREKWELYKSVFKSCWVQCINTFLVFFASLAVYPAVQANVHSVNHIFSNTYFVPVVVFLTFNLFAMTGNILASDRFPLKMGPKYIWIPITLRLLFIPFFLFCNFRPESGRSWPVLFNNDWVFWFGCFVLGLSSGYFSSLTMMYAPKSVKPDQAPIAGMMAGFFLITGIFAGVSSSFIWTDIVG